ncbi:hypothetical protein AJ80_02867 [Polytolypa hystricis UAMH7299]|uniref:Uncharacterized protein n=1 Tax=Polytolypa hystricis (strain UAMH7299) TaxID=1447883 RepID=A0A2B7YQ23_POLH7|nr:hypothetical protein AJ80_02867 [Polytolypa hystricis UAMH7299]
MAIHVHVGFTDTEMTAWRDRNKGIDMRGYSRAEIEDFTGRTPLLLDSCGEGGTLRLNAPEIESIVRQARRFVTDMKDTLDDRRWAVYRSYVRACIAGNVIDEDAPEEIIDHRYFYDVDELVLYIPDSYNHLAIDALVVHLAETDEGKTAHLYPIQVTIAERHKDSETEFFLRWGKWCPQLGDEYNISVTFLWIDMTEQYTTTAIEENVQSARRGLQYLNSHFDVIHIPLAQVNAEAWNRYKRAKDGLDRARE